MNERGKARGLLQRPELLALVTAALVAARALVGLADPVYYDPATLLDYSAVVLTTALFVSSGLALLAIRPRLGTIGRIAVLVPAYASIVRGVANLFEDGFGISALGLVWGICGLLILFGLLVAGVAVLFERTSTRLIGAGLLLLVVAFVAPESYAGVGQVVAWLVLAWVLGRVLPASADLDAGQPPTEGGA